jgi:SAM-dependent methyltransferase
LDDPRRSYDLVAADYAAQFKAELDKKPFDRKMLDLLADRVEPGQPLCDLGCGPGHVAEYLRGRGHRVIGIDLSPAMVREARGLFPEVEFQDGDLLDLAGVQDGAFGGMAALYCLIHVERDQMGQALATMRRVLRRGAPLLVSFHVGREVVHRDEWWGKLVDLDFRFLVTSEVQEALVSADFKVLEAVERSPYPEEYPSRRGYVFARAR